ncbi:MAG: hypothetical protein JWQ66_3242 [Mucilaginibacter sp.]|nr:hypothetical protein [Mucilaginibacter sp.]
MNKPYCLIADDVPGDAALILGIMDRSVLKGHYYYEICRCAASVPQKFAGTDCKIALNLIAERSKARERIDFAFLDMQFEHEFGKKVDGVNMIISALQDAYPLCRIIVISKNQGDFPDTFYKCNEQSYPTISKEAFSEYGPSIILKQAEIWTYLKCAEISAADESYQSLVSAFAEANFSLQNEIRINGLFWRVEDLFMYYTSQGITECYHLFSKINDHLFIFPKFEKQTVARWNAPSKYFLLAIKEYYLELYVFNYPELAKLYAESLVLFKCMADLYLSVILRRPDEIEKYKQRFIELRSNINLVGKVGGRLNGAVPKAALREFIEKLILRNVTLASYILLKMSIKSMVFMFTDEDHFRSGNDSKYLNTHLFLFGFKPEKLNAIDELINKTFSKGKNQKKLTFDLQPAKRNYETIYENASAYEKAFLKSAQSVLKEKIAAGSFTSSELREIQGYFEANDYFLNANKPVIK